eukprot:401460_1
MVSIIQLFCTLLTLQCVISNDIFSEVHSRHSSNVKAKYATKKETICIMTRDNICLSTNIYYPDPTVFQEPYSSIYQNTPYGKESIDDDYSEWNNMGWVYLAQDDRGRFQSNGTYEFFTNVGNDSLDTINWIKSASWSDNNIATYGISANALGQYGDPMGFTQYLWMDTPYNNTNNTYFQQYMDTFKHILIMQPSLGTTMGYHMVLQGGAYREGLTNGYLTLINEAAYIPIIQSHETFSKYWYPMTGPFDNQWNYYQQPIVHFMGWYDIFSTTQILTAFHINQSSINNNVKSQQIFIIEPGGHCPNGEIFWPNSTYGSDINEKLRKIAFSAAFNASRNNKLNTFDIHKYYPFNVLFYLLGPGIIESKGNYWIAAESFPDITNNIYYFGHNNKTINGTLSMNNKNIIYGNDSFFYNPKNPIQTWGGNNLIVQPCGPWDQNHNERGRTDILYFQSDILNQDMYLVGMISVNLFVSSSAVDTDFTVKLVDIFPQQHGSKNMLVQDSIYRMRWRNAMEIDPWLGFVNKTAPPMETNKIYNITVMIGYMSYTFNKGHKISISISSSNYKRFSINYNSGNMVIDGDKDWVNATNYIYYGPNYPSMLILPVVNDLQWIHDRKVIL